MQESLSVSRPYAGKSVSSPYAGKSVSGPYAGKSVSSPYAGKTVCSPYAVSLSEVLTQENLFKFSCILCIEIPPPLTFGHRNICTAY